MKWAIVCLLWVTVVTSKSVSQYDVYDYKTSKDLFYSDSDFRSPLDKAISDYMKKDISLTDSSSSDSQSDSYSEEYYDPGEILSNADEQLVVYVDNLQPATPPQQVLNVQNIFFPIQDEEEEWDNPHPKLAIDPPRPDKIHPAITNSEDFAENVDEEPRKVQKVQKAFDSEMDRANEDYAERPISVYHIPSYISVSVDLTDVICLILCTLAVIYLIKWLRNSFQRRSEAKVQPSVPQVVHTMQPGLHQLPSNEVKVPMN